MATRRMFDSAIISGDDFTDMPPSAQVLYFHLMGNADDDGFVGNPRGITRMAGCKETDLSELADRGFVIQIDKVIVVSHWHVHNKIRKDMYSPTLYQKELNRLTLDERGVYSLQSGPVQGPDDARNESVQEDRGSCNESVQDAQGSCNETVQDAQGSCNESVQEDRGSCNVGKDRLGKVRLGKDSIYTSANADANGADDGADGGGKRRGFDYAKYADAWNAAADNNGMTKVTDPKHWNTARKDALKRLCDKQGADMVLAVIKKAGESAFLGNSGRKWRASFDWFLKPGNFLKVREGNYTDAFDGKGKRTMPVDQSMFDEWDAMEAQTMQEMIAKAGAQT